MSSFPLRSYFVPVIQQFFGRVIQSIKDVLNIKGASSVPASVEAANIILDVLLDWLPVHAGYGYLRIQTHGTGLLSIIIQDGTIAITFVADLPFRLRMEPITVFKLDEKGPAIADEEKVRFIHLLLRRATWSHSLNKPDVTIEADWTWTTDLRPSAKWVALRKEAREKGYAPPLAQHWLTDDPQDITGA